MENLGKWLRQGSDALAEKLVDINEKQFIRDNISGFGMKAAGDRPDKPADGGDVSDHV